MTTNSKRYGAYHRVSQANGRDLDADSTITDKDAWERIDSWAKQSGVEIAERYLDWDSTGSKLRRPALDRMLADLRAGVIDGIAVAKTDRLSRAKTGDALRLVGEIQEIRPGSLALLDLGIDPTTPTGEAMLTILLAFAHMQWRQFRENWQNAQKRAITRGVVIGPTPFGYLRRDDGTLEPDDEHAAPIVTEAFRVAAGEGMHAAMAYLEREAPQRRWRTDEVRSLLKARVYLGEVRHGELENVAACEPLTTPAIWQAAQTEPRSRRTNGDYALTGLFTCGRCGSPLVGGLQTVKGRTYRRYRCASASCKGGMSINADKLEAYVREKLQAKLARKGFRQRFDVDGLEDAERTLRRAERLLEEYMDDAEAQELAGPKAWKVGIARRREAVDEASARLQALNGREQRSQTLPAAEQLDDPEKLRLAVAIVVDEAGPVVVQPGRGPVGVRVPLDHLDG